MPSYIKENNYKYFLVNDTKLCNFIILKTRGEKKREKEQQRNLQLIIK